MSSPIRAVSHAFWRGYGRLYRWYGDRKPYLDVAGDEAGTIIVAGSPRSGTTWLGNVVASATGSRQLFEPFILDTSKKFALVERGRLDESESMRDYPLYIRPSNREQSEFHESIRLILKGEVRGSWLDQEVSPGIYRTRLIKDVRINLILSYLVSTWPRLRTVWIVRNPLDVIESQIAQAAQGWRFDWDIRSVLDQPALIDDWLAPFVSLMEKASTLYDRLAHRWCIETYVPLHQGLDSSPAVAFVRYESLRTRASTDWCRVADLLPAGKWAGTTFERSFERPSATSRRGPEGSVGQERRRTYLSPDERRSVEDIVASYGLSGFCR